MPGLLAAAYDPDLELPEDVTREGIVSFEIERISKALAVVVFASTMPRRLGAEASDEEMKLEKQRCRRTAHALQGSLKGWERGLTTLPQSDEIRTLGARLEWFEFRDAHLAELAARMRLAATWALRAEEHKWGKSAMVRYQNEINWMTYALRD